MELIKSEQESNYILESELESERLNVQNKSRNYRIIEELRPSDYSLTPNQKILDAGSGTAEVTKFILDENKDIPFEIYMSDISEQRIENGLFRVKNDPRVKFSIGNLEELPYEKNTFDKIFCRYVYQHLENHQKVTNELFRVLKGGGELIIIDVNGLMFDMVTDNLRLKALMKKLRNGLTNFEPYVCGKIKGFLYKAGFRLNHIHSTTSYMQFLTPVDRLRESLLFRERFSLIEPTLQGILGSDTNEFTELFCKEIKNPDSYMEYDKKTIRAVKTEILH